MRCHGNGPLDLSYPIRLVESSRATAGAGMDWSDDGFCWPGSIIRSSRGAAEALVV